MAWLDRVTQRAALRSLCEGSLPHVHAGMLTLLASEATRVDFSGVDMRRVLEGIHDCTARAGMRALRAMVSTWLRAHALTKVCSLLGAMITAGARGCAHNAVAGLLRLVRSLLLSSESGGITEVARLAKLVFQMLTPDWFDAEDALHARCLVHAFAAQDQEGSVVTDLVADSLVFPLAIMATESMMDMRTVVFHDGGGDGDGVEERRQSQYGHLLINFKVTDANRHGTALLLMRMVVNSTSLEQCTPLRWVLHCLEKFQVVRFASTHDLSAELLDLLLDWLDKRAPEQGQEFDLRRLLTIVLLLVRSCDLRNVDRATTFLRHCNDPGDALLFTTSDDVGFVLACETVLDKMPAGHHMKQVAAFVRTVRLGFPGRRFAQWWWCISAWFLFAQAAATHVLATADEEADQEVLLLFMDLLGPAQNQEALKAQYDLVRFMYTRASVAPRVPFGGRHRHFFSMLRTSMDSMPDVDVSSFDLATLVTLLP